MSKQIINALTLALAESDAGWDIGQAKAFAEAFVAENADLFTAPGAGPAFGAARVVKSTVPLCPNCQQPTDDHLPGCARIPDTGTDPKAVTKNPLSPVA
jgi:hypothetical protein